MPRDCRGGKSIGPVSPGITRGIALIGNGSAEGAISNTTAQSWASTFSAAAINRPSSRDMPLPRVRVRLYGTTAQLAQARGRILAEYPPAPSIFSRRDGSIERIGGLFALGTDVRLRSRAAGDALMDRVAGLAASLKAIPVQGRITYHQCTHDDAIVQTCIAQTVDV